jgi:hypothetical protein
MVQFRTDCKFALQTCAKRLKVAATTSTGASLAFADNPRICAQL